MALQSIPCKIALFNQKGRVVNHIVIREFQDKSKKNYSWNSLTQITPAGCNADSINIRVAGEEISRRREQKKVIIILSDGEPSAYQSRVAAEQEVNESVKAVRRKGVIVIPIMLGDIRFLTRSKQKYETMYEKNVIACLPQKIITELTQLFRLIISR